MLPYYAIQSLLETDLYKLNMGQLIFSKHADVVTTWEYKCRNKDVKFTKNDAAEISRQLDHLCTLRFKPEEIKYIQETLYWLKPGYINFLKLMVLDRNMIHVEYNEDKYESNMRIWAEGPELITSHFEIPVLTIVSEVYFYNHFKNKYKELEDEAKRRFDEKLALLKNGTYELGGFSEFGLRRRLNRNIQEYIAYRLAEAQRKGEIGNSVYLGTSNVYLAMKTGVKPIGTMAHEIIEIVGQGDPTRNPAYSNRIMMDEWQDEFKGLNGIYLTDCIRTDLMLLDLTRNDARLWDGYRQDSGDPIEWGEKIIAKLVELGVDPKTKTLLWSDSLNFEKATNILNHFRGRCKVGFGIGTFITNDTFEKALNQVMKVVKVNGMDVAKVSDSEGKGMCQSADYVEYLTRCLNYRVAQGK